MPTVEKFSPCKVNLMLAILGPRPDGFHELLSLVAPTKFGDTLIAETAAGKTCDSLECNMEGVPTDSSNLVIKAAELFRQKTGLKTISGSKSVFRQEPGSEAEAPTGRARCWL